MPVPIGHIARDAEKVTFQPNDSFLLSYKEFILYFEGLETITAHHFVIGAHFAYGWMPTILDLKQPHENLSSAVVILNDVKRGRLIGTQELTLLRDTINNSLVGTSKLLHFINPNIYAIWDSRVCKYITGHVPYDYAVNPEYYVAYLANCKQLTQDPNFPPIYASMNKKIGYTVTPYRAVELVMFMNGG
jgi:hypothetical protein